MTSQRKQLPRLKIYRDSSKKLDRVLGHRKIEAEAHNFSRGQLTVTEFGHYQQYSRVMGSYPHSFTGNGTNGRISYLERT